MAGSQRQVSQPLFGFGGKLAFLQLTQGDRVGCPGCFYQGLHRLFPLHVQEEVSRRGPPRIRQCPAPGLGKPVGSL